jgi:thiol-disulfide isomerase/thioredoxin
MRRRLWLTALFGVGLPVALGATLVPAVAVPRAFRRGSWQDLRSAHRGRRTIVHFWGLTCGPCLVELPQWGQFHQAHPQAELVLVAADAVPQMPDAIADRLTKAGLNGVESWWFQDRFTERLFWEVDHGWQGELPFTVLIEPDGTATTQIGVIDDFAKLSDWLGGGTFRPT